MIDTVFDFILSILGAMAFIFSGLLFGLRVTEQIRPTWKSWLIDIALCVAGFMLFHTADRF